MDNLNLEKFNPTVAEITAMAEKYKGLEIQGIDDKEGYTAVDIARKELKKTRVQIQKTGKELRADALAFQKAVIARENELIEIIEPLEVELTDKQRKVNEEKEKMKRMESLPERREQLATVEGEATDDELLSMDDRSFNDFFLQKKSEFLDAQAIRQKEEAEAAERARIEAEKKAQMEKEEQEKKLQLEREKLEAEKKKLEDEKLAIENEKKRQVELEQAKKEAAEKARIEAEEKMKREKEAEERKVKEEQEKKEREEKEKIQREKDEQEKLERKKKYQDFLTRNEYDEKSGDFFIDKQAKKVVLYKKIDEFIL